LKRTAAYGGRRPFVPGILLENEAKIDEIRTKIQQFISME
jgi:hypothetical protein